MMMVSDYLNVFVPILVVTILLVFAHTEVSVTFEQQSYIVVESIGSAEVCVILTGDTVVAVTVLLSTIVDGGSQG